MIKPVWIFAMDWRLQQTKVSLLWLCAGISCFTQNPVSFALRWHVFSSSVMVYFSLYWRWSSMEHCHSLTVSRAENVVERKRPWLAFQSGKRSVGSMGGLGWDLAAFPNQAVCARMCALPKRGLSVCALHSREPWSPYPSLQPPPGFNPH